MDIIKNMAKFLEEVLQRRDSLNQGEGGEEEQEKERPGGPGAVAEGRG